MSSPRRLLLSLAFILSLFISLHAQFPTSSSAQQSPAEIERMNARVAQIIEKAEALFREGMMLLTADNKRAKARERFDAALDAILESGMDVRASQKLQTYYFELIERIYCIELPQQLTTRRTELAQDMSQQEEPGFKRQKFEPSPLDELSKLILTPEGDGTPKASKGSACSKDQLRGAALRGFRLGMSMEEIKKRIPGLRIQPADRFGYAQAKILPGVNMGRAQADRLDLKGVSAVLLDFLDNRLADIYMLYDDSVKWNSAAEFISRVSESLKLPNGWQPYRANDSYGAGGLMSLKCGAFNFVAGMTVVDYYGKLPLVYWWDVEESRKLQNRKSDEAERLRQKRLREEEERRKTFKP